jgi:hypothetical protein
VARLALLTTSTLPFRVTVPLPVLKVPAPAWEKLPEARARPVAPEIAPALEISMLVVSRAKVPEPPPILTRVLLVPVLMLVTLLVEALMEVAPVRVKPPVPWSRPDPELTPTPTMAPALDTVKLPSEIELLVLPLMTVEAPARPRVRAFWLAIPMFRAAAAAVSRVGVRTEVSA